MSGQWKPGDVASTGYGLAIRVSDNCNAGHCDVGDHWHTVSGGWLKSKAAARPLVVIDPESDADVDRMADLIRDHGDRDVKVGIDWLGVQAALRRFAAPTPPPRPDEPKSPGAVIEDTDGRLWARGRLGWTNLGATSIYLNWKSWDDADDPIAAVRVISEGMATA